MASRGSRSALDHHIRGLLSEGHRGLDEAEDGWELSNGHFSPGPFSIRTANSIAAAAQRPGDTLQLMQTPPAPKGPVLAELRSLQNALEQQAQVLLLTSAQYAESSALLDRGNARSPSPAKSSPAVRGTTNRRRPVADSSVLSEQGHMSHEIASRLRDLEARLANGYVNPDAGPFYSPQRVPELTTATPGSVASTHAVAVAPPHANHAAVSHRIHAAVAVQTDSGPAADSLPRSAAAELDALNAVWSSRWREREVSLSAELGALRRQVFAANQPNNITTPFSAPDGVEISLGANSITLSSASDGLGASQHAVSDLLASLGGALAERDAALTSRQEAEIEANVLSVRVSELTRQVDALREASSSGRSTEPTAAAAAPATLFDLASETGYPSAAISSPETADAGTPQPQHSQQQQQVSPSIEPTDEQLLHPSPSAPLPPSSIDVTTELHRTSLKLLVTEKALADSLRREKEAVDVIGAGEKALAEALRRENEAVNAVAALQSDIRAFHERERRITREMDEAAVAAAAGATSSDAAAVISPADSALGSAAAVSLASSEATVASLTADLASCRAACESAQSELATCRADAHAAHDAVQVQLADAHAARDAAQVQLADAHSARDAAKVQLADAHSARDAAKVQLAAANTARDAAQVQLASSSARADLITRRLSDTAHAELAAAQAARDAAHVELAAVTRRLSDTLADLESSRAAEQALTAACARARADAAETAAAATAARTASKSEISAALATIASLRADVASVKYDLKNAETAAASAAVRAEERAATAVADARESTARRVQAAADAATRALVSQLAEEHDGELRAAVANAESRTRALETARAAVALRAAAEAEAVRAAESQARFEREREEAVLTAREREAARWADRLASAEAAQSSALAATCTRASIAEAVVRREVGRRRALSARIADIQGAIRVFIRIRPSNAELKAMLRSGGTALNSGSTSSIGGAQNAQNYAAYALDSGRRSSLDSINFGLDSSVAGGSGGRYYRSSEGGVDGFGNTSSGGGGGGLADEDADDVGVLISSEATTDGGTAGCGVQLPGYLSPPVATSSAVRSRGLHRHHSSKSGTAAGNDDGGGGGVAVQSLGSGSLLLRHGAISVPSSAPGGPGTRFEFEEVFAPGAPQETVFDGVRPMLDAATTGTNVTIFAYGQTGGGKTYTMEGIPGRQGVIQRSLRHIFDVARQRDASSFASSSPSCFTVSISMTEIYNETVRDMLAGITDTSHQGGGAAAAAAAGEVDVAALIRQSSMIGVGGTQAAWSRGLRGTSNAPSGSGSSSKAGRGSSSPFSSSDSSSGGGGLAVRDSPTGTVEVVGLTLVPVYSLEEALHVIAVGAASRSVGSHALNERSSRSHMLTRVWITASIPYVDNAAAAGATGSSSAPSSRMSAAAISARPLHKPHSRSPFSPSNKPTPSSSAGRQSPSSSQQQQQPPEQFPTFTSVVNFVDLAGSERVSRSGAEGDRLREAASINSSLSTLGNVVSALKRRAPHVPFRDSKLTFILRDSLSVGSGARVLLLACVAPDREDAAESSCTLQFAARCRDTALGGAAASGGTAYTL